jgi:VWFA-related protein
MSKMSTLRRPSLSLAVIAALTCAIPGPAKSKDKERRPGFKFTSRSELVLIPTLVTDRSGTHIRGLKPEDFTVLENGVEQKISTFEEVSSDSHVWTRAESPNEFSNFVTRGPTPGRITIIVLDFLNTAFADQESARRELLKYLAQSADQAEPIALYTLTRSGIHVIHDFTTDPRVLAAALRKVNGETLQTVDSVDTVELMTGTASPDGLAGVSGDAVQSEADKLRTMGEDEELNIQSFQQRLAIVYTLQGLQQFSQALAGIPGRKSLIWASSGFPFSVSDTTMMIAPIGGAMQPSRPVRAKGGGENIQIGAAARANVIDVLPEYERTWQMLDRAQIALYPLDVAGLQLVDLGGASVNNPGRNYGRNMQLRHEDTLATFQTFAAMTGGRAYYNSNDLAQGFRDAVRDSAEYYMLGYYLDRTKTKPGWQKLAVKVKHDHVEVRARSGFFVTQAALDSGGSQGDDLALALRSPLDYTSLPLVARWGDIRPSTEPGKKHVSYQVHLAANLGLIDEDANNQLGLEFVALAKTPDGKPVAAPAHKRVEAHLTAEMVLATREEGINLTGALDLPPGEYTVRFVVRDELSGRIGSLAAPLKVD